VVLPDVNVLIYAFRRDAENHAQHRAFLDELVNGPGAFGLAEMVLAGFLRVVTHPAVFKTPTPMAQALAFVAALRSSPRAVIATPGPGHLALFLELCALPGIKGNLVPDAYLAALVIEAGGEWVTADRGFARFPGLRWRNLLTKA